MQLAGVGFNLWHTLHHLSTAWYLFWPQGRVVIFPFRVTFNTPDTAGDCGETGVAHHTMAVHMNPHKLSWSRLCFWLLLCGIYAPLVKMNSVPHLWNTYIPHVPHPQGSIIPRLVSAASTLFSVSVFWLQALSIYSFKSSGHLLDLWWWRLWPWDLSRPRRNKVSYREKEAVSSQVPGQSLPCCEFCQAVLCLTPFLSDLFLLNLISSVIFLCLQNSFS